MASRTVGKRYTFSYNDVKTDKDGWVNPKNYLPIPFEMVLLRILRSGKEKIVSGWWTGAIWDSIDINKDEKVLSWKVKEI